MIEQDIYTALSAVVALGNRIYPKIMPQKTDKPAAVYSIVSMVDNSGLSGCVLSQTARAQIDIYTLTFEEGVRIRNEVKASLYSSKLSISDMQNFDDYEDETELFRQIIDFSVRR
ncbi:MAG: DUF3168 domain-containing protein [Epsilonproteobacteria bacterium]|nr:DUF3168 domain-containing protein [Campylobacterota bacterium]